MKLKELIISKTFFVLIIVLFFHKFFFFGFVPFPGDLLISSYNPWKTYSYLGFNPGTYPSKDQYFDTARQIFPWKTYSINSIKNGQIPLWNPYNFSGAPLLANFQSSIFYPFNIFYFFLPQTLAWTIQVLLQPLLALLFTYLYLREIKRSKEASLFASIAFSFSLYFTVFLEYNTILHSVLYLPLVLYFLEKLIKKIKLSYLIGVFLALLFSFFAGHIQVFFLVFSFIFFYFLFISLSFKKKNTGKIILIFFAIILPLLVGGVQLLPTLELISNSARSNQPYNYLVNTLLLQPKEIILFLSPDFFGNPVTKNFLLSKSYPGSALYFGIIPFFFSILGIVSYKKDKIVRFYLLALTLLLLITFKNPLSELFFKIPIPLLSTSSPANAIFLISFSFATLSSFGIDSVWNKRRNFFYASVPVFFLIFYGWILFITKSPMNMKSFLLSNLILTLMLGFVLLSSRIVAKKYYVYLFIFITIFDLFYFFNKFNPFVPSLLVYPPTEISSFLKNKSNIYRFWGYGTANIEANFATQLFMYSPDGYDPLYPKDYGEFIELSKNGEFPSLFNNETRSDARIFQGFGENDFAENKYRQKVLNLLGVRYILDRYQNGTSEKTFPTKDFNKIYDRNDWRIFENLKVVPRFFLTNSYKVVRSKEEFEKIFFSKEFNPNLSLILEERVESELGGSIGKVKLVSYKSEGILFTTESKSNNLLFLSDTYYPGWKAFVDNQETKIFKANYAFRAILIPSGNHSVKFVFSSDSFKLGLKITIISLFIVILGSTIVLWKYEL